MIESHKDQTVEWGTSDVEEARLWQAQLNDWWDIQEQMIQYRMKWGWPEEKRGGETMTGWKRMLWTFGAVALWSLLSVLAVYQWDVFSMTGSDWQAVVVAVIAGVGMFATNYLMPFIQQYGIGSAPKA